MTTLQDHRKEPDAMSPRTPSSTAPRCYYWVCASVIVDADDRSDPRAIERAHCALACAQRGSCRRSGDCREVALSALARLMQQRPRR